jgi:hypothetical protein
MVLANAMTGIQGWIAALYAIQLAKSVQELERRNVWPAITKER